MSTAGQTIEADYTYNLLVAPSQISLIPEGIVQGGLARTATIQGQIDLSWKHRGPNGVNFWTSVGGNQVRIKNESGFPNESGPSFSGTAGVDYLTPYGVILGAAFTAGSQRQSFSSGGHFDQVDEAFSIYAAYKKGPLWGNAVATHGQLQDKIARDVTLGVYTDHNNADTIGQSQSLALRLGGDIYLGRVTTGPVGGLVLQQVHLNVFTETGDSGVTALTFGNQTRESAVSQLGWRVLLDIADLQPFAEAKWNHEWAGKDRSLSTSLTTVAATSYTMDAAPVASDWITTSLGASYKLNSRMMLRGEATAILVNPEVTSYGSELGVSVSF